MYAQLLSRLLTGAVNAGTPFQLADRVFLVATLVAAANHLACGNFIDRLIGDVEKVLLGVEQQMLAAGHVDLFADNHHAVRFRASRWTIFKLGIAFRSQLLVFVAVGHHDVFFVVGAPSTPIFRHWPVALKRFPGRFFQAIGDSLEILTGVITKNEFEVNSKN